MDQEQQSRWQRTRTQLLWAGSITTLAFLLIVICGYVFGWKWTGLPKQTLWDWLQLLIIPAVLAGGGLWFNRQQRAQELQTADRRAQDEVLQAYLDQMSDMLIPNNDQPSLSDEHPPDSLKTVARARTLTVLPRLDRNHKARVIQFLYEAALIKKVNVIVDLSEADLREANLRHAKLVQVALRYTWLERADLRWANLSGANLREANLDNALLRYTDLSGADLSGITLFVADFQEANLSNTNLSDARMVGRDTIGGHLGGRDIIGEGELDLRGADLSNANLSNTNLSDARMVGRANLSGANLSGATLRGAILDEAHLNSAKGWTEEQLAEAKALVGVTMPDGQILESLLNSDGPTLEEWLQSRGE